MDWSSKSKYILIVLLLLVPLTVFSQTVCPGGQVCPAGQVCICNPLQSNNILVVMGGIIDWIFTISIIIAVIMYIISGFYFLTAAGDPEKINTAKKMVLWVSIGLMIAIASKGIIVLIGAVLGVTINIP